MANIRVMLIYVILSSVILIPKAKYEDSCPDKKEYLAENSTLEQSCIKDFDFEDSKIDNSEADVENDSLISNTEINKIQSFHIDINEYLKVSNNSIKLFDYDQKKMLQYHHALQKKFLLFNLRFIESSAIWVKENNTYFVVARLTNYILSRIYITLFDKNWNEIETPGQIGSFKTPSFLPFPEEKNFNYNPQYPQIFKIKGDYFVSFSLRNTENLQSLWLFSFKTEKNYWLCYSFNDTNSLGTILSPIIIENEELMVYDHKNLQTLNCSDYETGCSGVYKQFSSKIENFYSGGPYTRFRNTSYYVSFTNIQYKIPFIRISLDVCEIYRPVLTIFKEELVNDKFSFRLIYSSNALNFNGTLFENSLANKNYSFFGDCYHAQLLRIESIINWDYSNDSVDALANVNDRINFVLKLNGLTKIVDSITHLDQTIDYSDGNKILINKECETPKKIRKTSTRKSRKQKRNERMANKSEP